MTPATKALPTKVKCEFESVLNLLSYYTNKNKNMCRVFLLGFGGVFSHVSTTFTPCKSFGSKCAMRTGLQVRACAQALTSTPLPSRKDLATEPATTSAPPNNRPTALAPRQPAEDAHGDGPWSGRAQPFAHTPRPLSLTHTTA